MLHILRAVAKAVLEGRSFKPYFLIREWKCWVGLGKTVPLSKRNPPRKRESVGRRPLALSRCDLPQKYLIFYGADVRVRPKRER